ncbi:MAG: membrane protein insertase YidC [Streptococcaceae bacterium]|jgi:YidC/Oxa1 family membrane protein insertase|nr:membrane protein insertase YidC [Streptococcaceae bacterium]MCH4176888.1 membrane protein insertase YidC [Streptococcaceae bacterium]
MKRLKQILFSGLAITLLLTLSGCVQTKNGKPTEQGWVWNLLVEPMSHVIEFFAKDANLGYGMAIIMVTIIVRLLILPLGLYQAHKSSYQQERMNYLKPVLEPLQNKLKTAATQEEKMAAQTELMRVQKENGINMLGGMGCLPLLIQMPFFSALFYAARYTPGISGSSFLMIKDLGERSLILVALAGIMYLIQGYVSMIGLPEDQKKQMKSMMIMSPLMIVFFSISSPAGVTLYWVIGGLFGILQSLITNLVIKPRLRKSIDEEFAKNPPKMPTVNTKDVTNTVVNPSKKTTKQIQNKQNSNKRNSGKQKR